MRREENLWNCKLMCPSTQSLKNNTLPSLPSPPQGFWLLKISFFSIFPSAKKGINCPTQAQSFITWFFGWSTHVVEFSKVRYSCVCISLVFCWIKCPTPPRQNLTSLPHSTGDSQMPVGYRGGGGGVECWSFELIGTFQWQLHNLIVSFLSESVESTQSGY